MSAAVMEDQALTDELAKLGPAPAEAKDSAPAPAPKRKSRSGTSGAERARRARGASTDKPPAAPRTRAAARPKIAEGMANLYAMVGAGVAMVPSGPAVAGPHEGRTITGTVGLELIANAQALGQAWEKAAKDDPRIREALERLLTVSTVGAIVAAHLPVLLAGLVAAGAAPAALLGAPAPEAAA